MATRYFRLDHAAGPSHMTLLKDGDPQPAIDKWATANNVTVTAWEEIAQTTATPPTQQQILDEIRQAAKALLDRQQEQQALIRAVVLETLTYANAKLTLIANTLQAKGVITAGERTTFVNGLATPAQARTSIKARLDAGEADI